MSNRKYFYTIDLFRGLASISILIWHYHHFYWNQAPQFPIINYPTQPFYNALTILYHHGDWLVKFFWIISGFVFAFVYWNRTVSFKQFFIARFARLYPLHLFTLLFIVIIQTLNYTKFGYFQIVLTNDIYHIFLQFFMASNWGFQDESSFNSPIWSISVEILIYGLFFLSLKYLKFKPFLVSSISIIVLLFISISLPLGKHWIAQCGFFFYSGVLIFFTIHKFEKKPSIILLLSTITLAIAVFIFEVLPRYISIHTQLIFVYVVSMSLFFSSILLFLAWIDIQKYSHQFSYQFKWIGNSTYSIYLWHLPLQVLILFIMDLYSFDRNIFNSKIVFFLWLFFMIIVGRLSYLYIEKPLKRIIKEKYINNERLT